MTDVPIEGPVSDRAPLLREHPWVSRGVWLGLFALLASVLMTAATLTPDPLGHGTHTQLGLPPCGFLLLTGLPCPGCGLTTCFTHLVQGEWVQATRANPFGVMLFFVSVGCAATAMVGVVRGLPVIDTLERLHIEKWVLLLAMGSLVVWTVRVGTLVAFGD